MLKKEYKWLCEVDKFALTNAIYNMDAAFQKFFKEHTGYPKFKSKHESKKSYTTNFTNNNICVFENRIKLPKIKTVKAVIHRTPPDGWKLKSATISQDPDGKYYCSVLYEYGADIQPVDVRENHVIGLDYKTSCLFMDSNGYSADMPKYYGDSSRNLAKKQRILSSKEVGSNNYRKAQRKLAKLHKHIANQRKDFLHKKSTEIANQYDLACIEDISIKEQIQNREYREFRKSTLDNGWYMFTVMMDYKLKDRGKKLIKVSKEYPSTKTCSCCGYVNDEIDNDSIRHWICPVCRTYHDRDVNAAVNIKNEGYRMYLAG